MSDRTYVLIGNTHWWEEDGVEGRKKEGERIWGERFGRKKKKEKIKNKIWRNVLLTIISC